VNSRSTASSSRPPFLRASARPPQKDREVPGFWNDRWHRPIYASNSWLGVRDQVFEGIEQAPERLREVLPGIGPVRGQRNQPGLGRSEVVREIIVFLHSHGSAPQGRAQVISRRMGTTAVQGDGREPLPPGRRDIRGIASAPP